MALLRRRDTVDLETRVSELHFSQRVKIYRVRQQYGIPITRQIHDLSQLESTDGDHSRPKSSFYLRRARIILLRTRYLGRDEARPRLLYVERHTSRCGTIFPPRPEFFYKVGAPDPHRYHWTDRISPREGSAPDWYQGETRTGPRSHKARSYSNSSPVIMLWRKRAGQRMGYRAEKSAFDSFKQRAEARALERVWQRKRLSSFRWTMSGNKARWTANCGAMGRQSSWTAEVSDGEGWKMGDMYSRILVIAGSEHGICNILLAQHGNVQK
ncbi:hypothetical protein PV11_03752 [Exophiala sideris]|uniref:Uncharacterized protein n=1 Tax=Exophiala sideris TaxID=1016849 RepID=A0A0D1Z3Z7_9EURO|nr:hypothetical protein PV11_03752 [Exophiala sideris]